MDSELLEKEYNELLCGLDAETAEKTINAFMKQER